MIKELYSPFRYEEMSEMVSADLYFTVKWCLTDVFFSFFSFPFLSFPFPFMKDNTCSYALYSYKMEA